MIKEEGIIINLSLICRESEEDVDNPGDMDVKTNPAQTMLAMAGNVNEAQDALNAFWPKVTEEIRSIRQVSWSKLAKNYQPVLRNCTLLAIALGRIFDFNNNKNLTKENILFVFCFFQVYSILSPFNLYNRKY